MRNNTVAFRLTPKEQELLELYRSGVIRLQEIGSSKGRMLSVALEKERLREVGKTKGKMMTPKEAKRQVKVEKRIDHDRRKKG